MIPVVEVRQVGSEIIRERLAEVQKRIEDATPNSVYRLTLNAIARELRDLLDEVQKAEAA